MGTRPKFQTARVTREDEYVEAIPTANDPTGASQPGARERQLFGRNPACAEQLRAQKKQRAFH